MNILGTKAWMWINGITLIIVGALSLVPAAAAIIMFDGGTILSIVKILVSVITLVVAFRETDMEMVNSFSILEKTIDKILKGSLILVTFPMSNMNI